jgi:protease I
MAQLTGKRVAVIALDGFEKAELTETVAALKAEGAGVDIISQSKEPIQAFVHQQPDEKIAVDRTLDEAEPDEYDALLLPGGALNADALRVVPKAQAFVKSFEEDEKPIAAICHAPWLLVSADLVEGRTLTSWPTLRDDIENAGGNWVDREVVDDGNLVTSRKPDDIPAFNQHMIALFAAGAREGAVPGPALNSP